jgi:hypothetical protein
LWVYDKLRPCQLGKAQDKIWLRNFIVILSFGRTATGSPSLVDPRWQSARAQVSQDFRFAVLDDTRYSM